MFLSQPRSLFLKITLALTSLSLAFQVNTWPLIPKWLFSFGASSLCSSPAFLYFIPASYLRFYLSKFLPLKDLFVGTGTVAFLVVLLSGIQMISAEFISNDSALKWTKHAVADHAQGRRDKCSTCFLGL